MAAQRTFDVPELLEHVLLQLPIKDLLFAQKVCKHWKQTIEASPRAQQALFFRPTLLSDDHGKLERGDIKVNPLISRSGPCDGLEDAEIRCLTEKDLFLRSFRVRLGTEGLSPEASCRRMLLYQPHLTSRPIAVRIAVAARCTHAPGASLAIMDSCSTPSLTRTETLGDLFYALEEGSKDSGSMEAAMVLRKDGNLSWRGDRPGQKQKSFSFPFALFRSSGADQTRVMDLASLGDSEIFCL